MGLLVDTSFLIAHEREGLTLPDDQELGIAAITASELVQGVHRGGAAHRARREVFVERVFHDISVIPFDLEVARAHARIWAELLSRGRVPPAHDLQVAATAVARGWRLATMDRRHFLAIPGLALWGA